MLFYIALASNGIRSKDFLPGLWLQKMQSKQPKSNRVYECPGYCEMVWEVHLKEARYSS